MHRTNDIQKLSKTNDTISRSKTELRHRILTHYLPLYFPEADRFHRFRSFSQPGIIAEISNYERFSFKGSEQ